jgi:hypothetical protein
MIVFRVTQERHGWAVQMDAHMTTPFRTRDLAVREAQRLVAGLRAHGQRAQVIVDTEGSLEAVTLAMPVASVRSQAVL